MTASAADPAAAALAGRAHPVCPYLIAAEGTWRAATPQRAHRCGALEPPAPIATAKQRSLCLAAEHVTCPTFIAATDAVEAVAPRHRTARFPIPRVTPVVLERGGPTLSPAILARQRGLAQGALLALMGIALVAILVARVAGPGNPAGAVASSSPSVDASVPASARPSPSPSPAPSPGPSPSAAPSPSPSPGPSTAPASSSPSPRRTYTVRSGDNLSSIAARYGTTVAVLARLNKIDDPSVIRVGQVLVLP
jgi:LysM repeat protein